MFSFKTPSPLQFEEMSREDIHRTNLKSIFDIDGVPSDTQFREVLDEVAPVYLKPVYKYLTDVLSHLMMIVFLFDQLQEAGCDLFTKAYSRCNNKKVTLWGFYKSLYNFQGVIEGWDMFMKIISKEIQFKIVFDST